MSEAAALGAAATALRLIWYLGGLGAAGLALLALGFAARLAAEDRDWLTRWRRRAALLGIGAALAGLLLPYGQLAAGGPLLDAELWGMVLGAPGGLAAGLGIAGCLALLAAGRASGAAGAAAVSASHAVAGHAMPLGPGGQVLVALHVALAAAWVASLPLLARIARRSGGAGLLQAWGRRAALGVPLLLANGLGLAAWLGGGVLALPGSAYGLALLAKLAAVLGMLGLAARHRFRLVPALAEGVPGSAARLARSLGGQAALALLALALVAAVAAGLFGPPPAAALMAGPISAPPEMG